MEDLERRQQREREKHKRQQVQSVGREYALFPEPRRVNPSEVDDDITAKLGDHSKAIEFMNTDAVGVQPSSNNALLSSHIQTSASSSASGNGVNSSSVPTNSSSSSQRLLACPPGSQPQQPSSQQKHHYQPQAQQQLRQLPYLKQADNKPPYNGRGGYPGQPVKNDLRSSSGMAPPKGPPPLLPPPNSILTAVVGSNNVSSSSSNTTTALPPPPPNGYLGPPKSTTPLHNGRFSKPLPKSINDIISKVDQTYRAPEQITKIAATPRTSIGEYNLNGPNRHKYSVEPIQPILGSPPSGAELLQSAVPPPIKQISALPATPNPQVMLNADTLTAIGGSSGAPTALSIAKTATIGAATTAVTTQSVLNMLSTTSAGRPVFPIPKEPLKPLLVDKVGPTLAKQNSTLENDLELSESDEDRRKQGRSMHNSSDSSPSDSSESGSEESSKSERQQPAHLLHLQQCSAPQQKVHTHHSLQNQQHVQQQQQQQQQTLQSVGRAGVSKSVNDKPKTIEPLGSGRSSIYLSSNTLGSAGSSSSGPSSTSSSSNKTPSPSDSSKWHLSRYFKPAQAQNDTPPPANSLVVNSINVSMDEPTLLPGGAQIIPEATQPQPSSAIVKHEAASYGAAKKFSARSDDDEETGGVRRGCDARGISSNGCGIKSSTGGGVPALLNEIKKESDVLYPSSLLKTSSSGSAQTHVHAASQQQQSLVPLLNAAEFVAIPTSQIKHEIPGLATAATTTAVAPMSLAGGTTTVTPYNTSCVNVGGSGRRCTPSPSPHMRNSVTSSKKTGDFARVSHLSAPSSDGPTSNGSDNEDDVTTSARPTVPTLGPGGTLKIPGVPARITALPPSSTQPLAPAPTIPNSITVLPLDPLPTTAPTRRRKKPRNSAATITTHLDTSDEEEMAPGKSFNSGGVTVSPAALRAAAGPGGKLYAEPMPVVATKKRPGRPRKAAGIGTATNATAAAAKGPTLTAKKDVPNSGAGAAKKPSGRRRVSRKNSTTTALATKTTTQAQQPVIPALPRAPSIDSSSSSSTSFSTSKTSTSSSSDSEGEEGIISGSSSDNEDENAKASSTSFQRNPTARPTAVAAVTTTTTAAGATAATTLPVGTSRIIVQLNKRKASHDDPPPTTVTTVAKTGSASKLTNSSKRIRIAPPIALAEEEADSDDDSSDSGSSSDDSSVSNFNATTAHGNTNVAPAIGAGNTSGSSSHRSQNLQSPYKVSISAATVSSSSSNSNSGTSSSTSNSSGGEHSDTERSTVSSNRVGKSGKTGPKTSTCVSSGSSATRLRRDKPKASDNNKNVTLTRIFNPKEGGAKKQGQVLVIDQSSGELSGEQQQQKLISPNAAGYRTTAATVSALSSSQENLTAAAPTSQSPRLTPGHMKSPRALSQLTTASSHRTPDRSSRNSAERKVQQQRIKTPSCTPTRTPPSTRTPTPTPAGVLLAPTASPMRSTATVSPIVPSLICKVDLSRLFRILPEWRANTYRLSCAGAGTSAMAILNVDLQATTVRLVAGGSGTDTPHSTGNRTPKTSHAPPDRELSRSRDSLIGVGVGGGKKRLSTVHSNGRRNSRSTDGGGSSDTTPKEQSQHTPNGYTSTTAVTAVVTGNNSPSTKQLLKYEQLIKHEPGAELDSASMEAANKTDTYCGETKFKATGSVKQEVLILKQDFKPGLPPPIDYGGTEKQVHHEERHGDSPTSHLQVSDIAYINSQQRKRSASSSPYKERKRKKERTDKYSRDGKEVKEVKEICVLTTPAMGKEKEKDLGKLLTAAGTIERDIGSGLSGVNDTSRRAIAKIPLLGTSNNGQMEKDLQVMDNRQLPPTNHDRLPAARQMHQQQQNANDIASNSSHSPAHLQTAGNNLITSPIAGETTVNVRPSASGAVPLAPPPQVIYRSYFERDDDGLCDDISENSKFLEEAVTRKHAADKEQNLFNQVTLYLEAVIYFLLSSAGLEQHRNSEESSWVMYKDTLNLIKFISSKIKHLSSSANELHEPHNKVAILSLRCQSLISLKLYKMKRLYCRTIINHCMEMLKSGRMEILNGNTPSSNSPSNSVCSQGSGSNTPPGRIMRSDMLTTISHQNLYFNYLSNCHDLWDQADRLVRQGNHTDFFIALDHENGPLTLHSSMYDLFRYVQSGLKKLKSANTTTTMTVPTTTSSSGSAPDNAPGASATTTAATTNSTTSTTTIYKCSMGVSKLHPQ